MPGGTQEDEETVLETMLREVQEEAGVIIDADNVSEVYSGTDYSTHGTDYALFVTNTKTRPAIRMSWEHSSYEWISRDGFLQKAKRVSLIILTIFINRLMIPAK